MNLSVEKSKRWSFLSVCLTFFVDYLSWAVVFPIFAPYFLDVNNRIFSADVQTGTRMMILGFFLMAFSLGQFLGAPLLGEYADKYGRRKALLISVSITLLGLCLTAYSMGDRSLIGLFLGRFITGFFASSATVCLSCASDLSENEHDKVKKFGTLSMVAGIAFVVGAFAGGKLSDRTLYASFADSVPIWIAAVITLFNWVFLFFAFRETTQIHAQTPFYLFEAFRNITTALQTEKVKRVYTVYFLFFTAWTILFQFIPALMVERFSFTNSDIGDLALFMGVCWVIGAGYLNKYIVHRFNRGVILELCLIGFTVLCSSVVLFKHMPTVMAIIGLCILSGSIAWPICTGLISSKAPMRMQGKVLGLSQSVQSLAMTVGPVLGGLAFHHSIRLPFFIAGGVSALSVLIYYFILKDR